MHLVCSADAEGRSHFRRQSFCAPFHLSKPHTDEGVLVAQIVNPTACLLEVDHLRSAVTVESGARLHLTSPSARRVHTMRTGIARVEQRFEILAGAWLDYFPSPLIPQTNCRYGQSTWVTAESGAEFLLMETLAPGRVAHGEVFAFHQLEWTLEIRLNGKLSARERHCLRPDDLSMAPLRSPFARAYYSSGWLLSARLLDKLHTWEQVSLLQNDQFWIGASQVADTLWSIRVLAADSLAMTQGWRQLRNLLATEIPELKVRSRRF